MLPKFDWSKTTGCILLVKDCHEASVSRIAWHGAEDQDSKECGHTIARLKNRWISKQLYIDPEHHKDGKQGI